MKKILSVILVLAMVLALGTTAFAADPEVFNATVEAGKKLTLKYEGTLPNAEEYKVSVEDRNNFLTVDSSIVGADYVVFEVTAPAGTGDKLAKIAITAEAVKAGLKDYDIAYYVVSIEGEKVEDPKKPDVVDVDDLGTLPETTTLTVVMGANKGISAKAYNAIKAKNYETITFVGDDYAWVLTRGDYTKMNVTADIIFDARVEYRFTVVDVNDSDKDGDKTDLVVDPNAENTVLKALDSTQADVFYVVIDDMCNIANVASKPSLVINVRDEWIKYSNKFNVTGYKFNGETVAKATESLAVKPATQTLALNLTAGGRYVFVADNYTVNPVAPSTPSEKPNASTGANSAAAVVALAVMAVAAVASKKIVK